MCYSLVVAEYNPGVAMSKQESKPKQIIGDVRVYSRHSETCDHVEDSSWLKCNCPKWLQYAMDGKSKRESANSRSFAGVKLAAEQKTKELRGEVPSVETTVQATSVDVAIQDWLRFRETNGLGNDKPKLMGGKLLTWCRENGVTFLYQLTSDKVMQFRNSLPYKTKTSSSLKIHWAIMCNFFGWAHGIGLVAKNPVPNTRLHPQFKIRFKKAEVVPPTTAENATVIAALEKTGWNAERKHRVQKFIETMTNAGMAIRDTATLGRNKLDADNRIRGNRCKTNERFKVRIPAKLADDLRSLPCDDPAYLFWYRGQGGQKLKVTSIVHNYTGELRKLFALAKVDMTPHGFRHYFITQRLAQGWSVDEVSTMVGTSPQEIRKTYQHWIKEEDDRIDAKWLEKGLDATS
jgi:integrase